MKARFGRGAPWRVARSGATMLVLSLGACLGNGGESSPEPLILGEDVRLEGRVINVDATPMFVDGDGEITLQTEDHGRVLVLIPARERVCLARGLGAFPSIAPGDSVRATGRVTRRGEVTVCVEEAHALEKLGGS